MSAYRQSVKDYDVKLIILFACLASIVISFWSYFADPIINNDGIDYVRAADALLHQDFDDARQEYKWLFYPSLIAGLHKLTGLSYEIAAHTINAFCNVLTVISFILLTKLYGAGRTTATIAAIVIVTFPGLNEIRSYIVRDHGYIAFYLTSFYYFCHYALYRNKLDYLLSLCMALIAFLFRIEGLIFAFVIVFLPILVHIKRSRLLKVLVILAFIMCIFILMGVYGVWLYTPTVENNYSKLSFNAVFVGWEQLSNNLSNRIDVLMQEVLNTASNTTGRSVYLWTATGVIMTHMMTLLTLMYTLFFIYGLRKNLVFPKKSLVRVWTSFVVVNFAILLLFTLTQLFLTDRYPLPMAITVLFAVVFAISYWYKLWLRAKKNIHMKGYRFFGYVVLVLLVANAIQGFNGITNKKELIAVSDEFNKMIQPDYDIYNRDNVIFTNSKILGYYTGVPSKSIRYYEKESEMLGLMYHGKWVDYQYILLDIKPNPVLEEHFKNAFWAQPQIVIPGRNNHEYRLYDIKQYRKDRAAGKIR